MHAHSRQKRDRRIRLRAALLGGAAGLMLPATLTAAFYAAAKAVALMLNRAPEAAEAGLGYLALPLSVTLCVGLPVAVMITAGVSSRPSARLWKVALRGFFCGGVVVAVVVPFALDIWPGKVFDTAALLLLLITMLFCFGAGFLINWMVLSEDDASGIPCGSDASVDSNEGSGGSEA
jgi:hypothetical protein